MITQPPVGQNFDMNVDGMFLLSAGHDAELSEILEDFEGNKRRGVFSS